MPNKPRAGITLLTALIAFLVPVLASAYLAWWESYTTEKTLSLAYAQDVLRRMEDTSSQLKEGAQEMAQANLPPCSPQDIKLMRQVDFGFSYMKAVGRVANDTLLCTSQGVTNPVSLGKPDLVTEQGVSEYFNKHLDSQPSHPLNVFAIGAFAMIVDPNLAVNISTEGPDVELAAFVPSSANRDRVAAQGQDFPSDWFETTDQGTQSTILNNGYLVSRVSSASWDLAVVAATPQDYIYQRISHFAVIFLPIGVLCGAIFSLMIGLLARMHSSFPTMLRRALKDGSLYVLYQPVVELSTRRVIGAEALVRWRSRYADMRPDYFIPQAEQCDMIQLITEQVLAMVARDLPQFLKMDRNFCVAVNFSAADLCDSRTVDAMDQFLRISGARPENIEVEATERAFLQGPQTAEIIDALRAKGFSVAIDDFGTGYSSLSCLQSLSLDTLKIDRAFVDTINTDGATSQVVLHIIEMAHSLHLEMVAEGVETEPQAQYLVKRGVRYAQGWHFGRPMDIGPLCEQIRIHATPENEKVLV
ncbi:MAG: EAL domain-containing protein [Terracidiphilus sp.]|jgi:sensor c-di-GMP phosphodiesterase-like protein